MFAVVETYQEDELLRGDRAKESEGRADIQIRPSSVSSPFSSLSRIILRPTSEFYLGEPQNYSFRYIYFYFMWVFYLKACVFTMCVQYPWRPEGGIRSSGTGVTEGFKTSCGCWEQSQGLLQEQ